MQSSELLYLVCICKQFLLNSSVIFDQFRVDFLFFFFVFFVLQEKLWLLKTKLWWSTALFSQTRLLMLVCKRRSYCNKDHKSGYWSPSFVVRLCSCFAFYGFVWSRCENCEGTNFYSAFGGAKCIDLVFVSHNKRCQPLDSHFCKH